MAALDDMYKLYRCKTIMNCAQARGGATWGVGGWGPGGGAGAAPRAARLLGVCRAARFAAWRASAWGCGLARREQAPAFPVNPPAHGRPRE